MKRILEIIELLRNIRFELSGIAVILKDNPHRTDKHVTTLVAQTSDELARVFSEVSKSPIPPLELGEYYVVKVHKRNF